MVCQEDDRLKYSVASVLIRVLSENLFPPVFNRTTLKGFIIQSSSPASIVTTYGNQVLQIQVSDRDFSDGQNPNIHYSVHPPSELYQVTQGGVLIARTDRLHAFDRHILQVVARDEESGEEASASVDIEVLQRGQSVPRGAFTEQQMFGDVDSRLAGGIAAMILLLFISAVLFLLLRTARRRRLTRNPDEHAAGGKHPSMVSSSRPVFSMDESSYRTRAFTHQYESSSQSEGFHGRQGVYTRKQSLLPLPSSSSSSSSHIFSGPTGRFHSELYPVIEKPEPLGSCDVRDAPQSTAVITDDPMKTQQSQEALQEDLKTHESEKALQEDLKTHESDEALQEDLKTHESEEALQDSEDPYRTMASVIFLSEDEYSSEDADMSVQQPIT
ncbi:uncharacterized protein LOC119482388 isoform X1 [Sebastes umbrosus]|uniref:uncharacterized protein LOC119482388 isoform X1 n=1 Tax=Sebastes umbrosus TaxID=72105 RepID=UPI00189F803C|nr:uncharacterized protein LOC119482388 isoform X1 [Sebastes umbrosus]